MLWNVIHITFAMRKIYHKESFFRPSKIAFECVIWPSFDIVLLYRIGHRTSKLSILNLINRIYFIRICLKHITIIDVRYQFGHKLPKVDHCDINDFFALRSWPYFNWLHNTHATLDFIQKMISCKYQITIPLIIT